MFFCVVVERFDDRCTLIYTSLFTEERYTIQQTQKKCENQLIFIAERLACNCFVYVVSSWLSSITKASSSLWQNGTNWPILCKRSIKNIIDQSIMMYVELIQTKVKPNNFTQISPYCMYILRQLLTVFTRYQFVLGAEYSCLVDAPINHILYCDFTIALYTTCTFEIILIFNLFCMCFCRPSIE